MAPKSSTAGGLKASETFSPGRGDLVLLFNVSCYYHVIIDLILKQITSTFTRASKEGSRSPRGGNTARSSSIASLRVTTSRQSLPLRTVHSARSKPFLFGGSQFSSLAICPSYEVIKFDARFSPSGSFGDLARHCQGSSWPRTARLACGDGREARLMLSVSW